MILSIDFNILVGVLSTIIALVSLIFAWRAVNAAERNNFAGIYTELHKIYQSSETFKAIKVVWGLYNQYEGSDTGNPISNQQAHDIVSTLKGDTLEWQAIHESTEKRRKHQQIKRMEQIFGFV